MTPRESSAFDTLRTHVTTLEAEVRERLTVVETQQKQIIQQAEDHGKTIKEIHGAIVEDRAIKKALKYLISVPFVGGGIAWLFHHLTGISLPK